MSSRVCRQADLWMAAVDAGELDEASRIRLLDHLDSCPACARRNRGISRLVALLRDEGDEARDAQRLQQVWNRVAASGKPGEDSPAAQRSPVRSWAAGQHRRLGLLVASLAVAAVGAMLVIQLVLLPRPARSPAADRPVATARQMWRALALTEARIVDAAARPVEGQAGPGDLLAVGPGGRAVLTSAAELIVIRASTELRFATTEAGSPLLRLHRGAVAVRTLTRSDPRRESVVHAGPVRVRPMGTVYAVRWRDHQPPEVAVAEGRVEVSSGGQRVVVVAGQQLVWGGQVRRLDSGEQRALERELDQPQRLAFAQARASEPRRVAPAPPRPASRPHAIRDIASEMRGIERLLTRGESARARSRAQRLLALPEASRSEAALFTLVAESHVRERHYAAARDAYLRVWTRHPRTPFGADGLYMVGSLELEQLHQPPLARQRFERYLAAYPRGRQREGAYYLLCQALLRAKDTKLAQAVARRYLAEFPRGQLRPTLERLVEPRTAPPVR